MCTCSQASVSRRTVGDVDQFVDQKPPARRDERAGQDRTGQDRSQTTEVKYPAVPTKRSNNFSIPVTWESTRLTCRYLEGNVLYALTPACLPRKATFNRYAAFPKPTGGCCCQPMNQELGANL